MNVLKRDGRLVEFNPERIRQAINAARSAVRHDDLFLVDTVTGEVSARCHDNISVEEIQDLVEQELEAYGASDVAKAYHDYRVKRTMARNAESDGIISSIVAAEKNDITRENANMNADTPAGMMMKIASERSKQFVDDFLLSDEARAFQNENMLHVHDKDYFPTRSLTCVAASTNITIKHQSGKIENIKCKDLDRYFGDIEPTIESQSIRPNKFIWIMGRNGWTKITGISRRVLTDNDTLYALKPHKGCLLEATGEHLIPVIDAKSGEEKLKSVKQIKVGDKLLKPTAFQEEKIGHDYIDLVDLFAQCAETEKLDVVITNIDNLRGWLKYKYGIGCLAKLIGSETFRYGTAYITIADFVKLCEDYEIPYDVVNSVDIHSLRGKDFLPVFLPVTTDLAKIIGYLHSDGSITCCPESGNYQITFTGYNKAINQNFEEVFSRVFPNHLAVRYSDGLETGRLFSSKLLSVLFKFVLGRQINSGNISIPDFILNGTDETKWSYLSAVFDGDGCIKSSSRGQISLSTSCKTYADELVLLLKSLGVESAISVRYAEGSYAKFPNNYIGRRNYDFYKITITGYDNIAQVLDNLCCIKRNSIDVFYAAKPSKAVQYDPCTIKSKLPLAPAGNVVYDLETAEHWWTANGFIVHNCLQHPLDKILGKGFKSGHGESRPAKRIETASILGCISLESIQNECHGGQSIPAFDFYIAPYVRAAYVEELKKLENSTGFDLSSYYNEPLADYIIQPTDELRGIARLHQSAINATVKRVHQAMEAFIHNLNTIHSRGGNQVVFSSINYGTDTSAEGRCVMRELLNTTYRGVGNGSTAIFPIQIMKMKDGVNKKPGDPNYDLYQLGCKVTAKRFFPNFLNLDATFNQHEEWKADDPERFKHEVATMGCRTRVFENRHGEKTSIGRGNLSFSTMNLPGLALSVMNIPDEAERVEAFFKKLSELTDVTAHQLLDRYKFQCEALAKQFPLLMSGMWVGSENLKPTDKVAPVLKQGTLGVGFIGLAECLIALIGEHHGESQKAQELGLSIIKAIKKQVDGYSDEYNLNFSVLATPAEGLSGKFTKKDRKKYGVVKGVTDKDYYTNSNHVPVYYHCSAKHKAEVEGPYHELTRGGHIFYVELDGDATHNVQAIDDVVKLMDKYNIGYASVNHNRNRCMDCGYEDASKDLKECPVCGSHNIDRLQRITGYLVGTTDRWNSGKLAELNDRVTHGL